jgi:hypothetical protein
MRGAAVPTPYLMVSGSQTTTQGDDPYHTCIEQITDRCQSIGGNTDVSMSLMTTMTLRMQLRKRSSCIDNAGAGDRTKKIGPCFFCSCMKYLCWYIVMIGNRLPMNGHANGPARGAGDEGQAWIMAGRDVRCTRNVAIFVTRYWVAAHPQDLQKYPRMHISTAHSRRVPAQSQSTDAPSEPQRMPST